MASFERRVKKGPPHRVVIERGGNGVSVTAHQNPPHMSFRPGEPEPQPMFFSKASAAKKHVGDHLEAMMAGGGEEPPEQGSGAPNEAV